MAILGISIATIIVTIIVTIIGIAVGYGIYLRVKPKIETWKAKIYWYVEGERPKPYRTDTIEKIRKAHGITVYRLQGMKLPVPAVTGEVIENWGKDKTVNVLTDGSTCTLLEKIYRVEKPELNRDGTKKSPAEYAFNPIPFDRQNLMRSEQAMHSNRLKEDKNVLQTIATFVVAAILMFGLVAIAYFNGQTAVSVANTNQQTQTEINEVNIQVSKILSGAYSQAEIAQLGKLGKQTTTTTTTTLKKPPPIE